MRCLPASKLPLANGRCLHDWHAEIVALRAFNLFLVHECKALLAGGPQASCVVRRRGPSDESDAAFQPFTIQDDIRIHMYCSEAPCGDASMELIMAAQDDATPWEDPVHGDEGVLLNGRGQFAKLGVVRRKPSRADAPVTLSKSCSDKLSLRQCTSVLSSLTSLLLSPRNAYLHNLILPESQHVPAATRRAFSPQGRMSGLVDYEGGLSVWPGDYAFRPFEVSTTTTEFAFSRRMTGSTTGSKGSNITAMWTPHYQEVLVGGTVQGNKALSLRGASAISKLGIWKAVAGVVEALAMPLLLRAVGEPKYAQVKISKPLEYRRMVKRDVISKSLKGWISNGEDEGFELNQH